MENYYIADMHLGHANCLQFDHRPFDGIDEMDRALIANWNQRVTPGDTVYILGDFIWRKASEWLSYLEQLSGQKVLITGNHDPKGFDRNVRMCFQDVKDYKEITDNERKVILCHYPIPFHKSDYQENCWMLYGHVHCSYEYEYLKKLRAEIKAGCVEPHHAKGNFINIGCMLPYMGYTPRTLDEIIAGDMAYR